MATYATAANLNLQKLNKIHNTELRIIAQSTLITTMEATTGLQNLEERREEKIIMTRKVQTPTAPYVRKSK